MGMLIWLQAHWLGVFTAWVALNSILSPVSAKVPATTWYGKALHVFVAVSPMDVMKAIKTVGAAVIPPIAGAAVLALVLVGCGASPTPVAVQTVDPRALARASTSLLEDAWLASAKACVTLAVAQNDDTIRQKCETILTPARNALIAADSAIDVWGAAEQKNFPCLVSTVSLGLLNVSKLSGIQLPQLVADGLTLAQSYAGKCAP